MKKNEITMYNPKNNVTISTNESFKAHWEKLGFIPLKNVVIFQTAVA